MFAGDRRKSEPTMNKTSCITLLLILYVYAPHEYPYSLLIAGFPRNRLTRGLFFIVSRTRTNSVLYLVCNVRTSGADDVRPTTCICTRISREIIPPPPGIIFRAGFLAKTRGAHHNGNILEISWKCPGNIPPRCFRRRVVEKISLEIVGGCMIFYHTGDVLSHM